MGAKKSKAGVDSSAILEKPWREIKWSDESGDLQWIKNYKPQTEGQQLRILLHGPCKAGKSSFINSVQNVLQASISELAPVNTAYYQKFTTYKMVNGPSNTFYPFVFNEMMGLKDDSNRVQVNDIKHALKGHVKDGYTFNPVGELTEDSPDYNESPTINDKVHILVCVIDASTDDTKNGNVIKTLRDIRAEASKLEIPQLAIFTKIDKAFPEIEKDVKNTYRSKRLREKMLRLMADVGIPMNCIFATQNCLTEKHLDSDINTLFLSTLRCIIHFGDDFLNSNIVK